MGTCRSTDIIEALTTATDLQRVLEEQHLTPVQLMTMLRSKAARRQLNARRRLAKIHSELVAHRFGPYAMHKLCQLLSDDKSELRLKGALSVLAAAGLDGKGGKSRAKRGGAASNEGMPPTPEDGVMLLALAEVMRQQRAADEAAGV